jgi:hypothetical protein
MRMSDPMKMSTDLKRADESKQPAPERGHLFASGYTRLLSKLGRAGRLQSMGVGLEGEASYIMCYAPGKTIRVVVPEHDAFTSARDKVFKRGLDKGPAK